MFIVFVFLPIIADIHSPLARMSLVSIDDQIQKSDLAIFIYFLDIFLDSAWPRILILFLPSSTDLSLRFLLLFSCSRREVSYLFLTIHSKLNFTLYQFRFYVYCSKKFNPEMTALCFVTPLASPLSLSSPSLTADNCAFFRRFHAKQQDQFTKRCIIPVHHDHGRHNNADTTDNEVQKSTSTDATWKMTTSPSSSSSETETETESTATTTSSSATKTTTTTTTSTSESTTTTGSNNEAGTSARGEDARRLALWLSAEWSNRHQAIENPPLWSHIHVTFRPLPWSLLNGYAMYTESAYDYDLSTPYKTSIVHIVNTGGGELELASYKINRDPEEFWSGVFEPSLLEPLTRDHLTKLRDECNTVFKWIEQEQAFVAMTRPGKQCRIRRSPNEVETYLDCRILLTDKTYSAWDIGKDLETDQRVWGTVAGPFQFSPVQRFRDFVPDEE